MALESYLLEIVSDLKFALLSSNVRFDFSVSVVDDGQEHVKQDEEDEEHVSNEEGRAKDTVGVLDLVEVEVTKDDTEQSKARGQKSNKNLLDSSTMLLIGRSVFIIRSINWIDHETPL